MNVRSSLFLLAKAFVAAGILWWLFAKVDAAKLWGLLSSARLGPLLAIFLIGVLTVLVAAWRWRTLLTVFGINAPLGSLFCIAWIGQFFLMFLPGPIGDDAARMIYISRAAPGRAGEACLSVMLDRAIGLGSVLVMCLFVVPLQWSLLRSSAQTFWMAGAVLFAGLCFLLAGISFLACARALPVSGGVLRLLPEGRLRTEAIRLWDLAAGAKLRVCQVFGAALFIQLLNCAAYWLAGVSVGVNVSLLAWISFVPVILAANVVPLTIAGLGVREYLLVLFLGVVGGVDAEQAMAASLVVFGAMVLVSSLGGLVYVLYRGAARGQRVEKR